MVTYSTTLPRISGFANYANGGTHIMGMPGITELIIILAIVFLLFGAKRLPDLAKGLGQSITNFKAGLNENPPEETEKTTTQAQQENGTPPKEKTG